MQMLAELHILVLSPCLSTNDVEAQIFDGTIYNSHERTNLVYLCRTLSQ